MPFCPNCGVPNDTDFKFCQKCGQALKGDQIDTAQKPGILLIIGTIVATLICGAVYYLSAVLNETEDARMGGYVFGGAILLPLIVVAISSIWKRMRNLRSALKVFFIATLVFTALTIVNILATAGETAQNS